jgi:integrase
MGWIYKQPESDNWFAKFKGPDGRYKRVTTGTSDKAMAKKVMIELERIALKAKRNDGLIASTLVKYAQEASELVTGQSIGIPSTKEFFEGFLKAKEVNKKEGTLRSYKTTVGKFLAHLGKVASQPIDKIKPDHVQAFVKARAADGTSPATIRQSIVVLRMIFKKAKNQQLCAINPVDTIETPEGESKAKVPFTVPEVNKILKACQDEEWRTLVHLGFYTGGRIGDCLDLRWESFDLGAEPSVTFQQKKTGKNRKGWVKIAIHRTLKERLEEWRLLNKAKSSDYVLPSFAGKDLGGRAGVSTQFIEIMEKAGVDPQRSTTGKSRQPQKSFHSFRTTLVSTMQSKGVAQDVRMQIVGHTSADVHNIYSQGEWNNVRAAIDKLPELAG